MPRTNPQLDPSLDSSRLASRVAELAEQLQTGATVDLHALCAECPEHFEQLEMLLPTLEAVVSFERSLPLPNDPNLQPPASSLQPSSPAGVLGDFRLIRELGRGGMGVVYEAEQLSLGRRVALKVLPFAAMLDKQQLKRFKNEARAAATLDHPNIVAVYSVGEERGVHYYAMQLVEGESLAQMIARLRAETPELSRDAKVRRSGARPADELRTAEGGRSQESGVRKQEFVEKKMLRLPPPPRGWDQPSTGDPKSPERRAVAFAQRSGRGATLVHASPPLP